MRNIIKITEKEKEKLLHSALTIRKHLENFLSHLEENVTVLRRTYCLDNLFTLI